MTMKLLNIFKRFSNEESGAVTVDFVVLTGAVVALGLTIGTTLAPSITTATGNVGTALVAATE